MRVATFALLTFTTLLGSPSCGVVIAKFSGHAASLLSSPTVFGDVSLMPPCSQLHPHRIWQATKSYLERGDVFGLISQENSLLSGTECSRAGTAYNFSMLSARRSCGRGVAVRLCLLRSSCVGMAPFSYIAGGARLLRRTRCAHPQALDIAIHRHPLSDVQSLRIVFTEQDTARRGLLLLRHPCRFRLQVLASSKAITVVFG